MKMRLIALAAVLMTPVLASHPAQAVPAIDVPVWLKDLSAVEKVQCRRIWRTRPYCTYTRYRGRVCGRRGYWQTVCSRRSRLQRYCYRTHYRGTICGYRRVYY